MFCPKCNQESREGSKFCIHCGTAINKTSTRPKSHKMKAIIVSCGTVLLAALILAIVLVGNNNNKKAALKNLSEEYLENTTTFSQMVILCGSELENITDAVLSAWGSAVGSGSGIESHIKGALYEKKDEISQANSYQAEIEALFKEIRKSPDGANEEMEEICVAINALYTAFDDYYRFAISPSGNYTSYSSNNNEKKDALLSKYRALQLLIESSENLT